jgi:acetyl esterase/lipase
MKKSRTTFLILALLGILTGCSRAELLNALIPPTGYRLVSDIPYADHERGSLDIYMPDNPLAGNPVVVFYYGGSWKSGRKKDYLFVGQALASQGIIVVIPDYRLYPQVRFPDFMHDVAEAYVWTHRHIGDYGGNPENIFAAGHSAGAYNAVMLSVNKAYIDAAGGSIGWIRGTIGLAGPYDFLPIQDKDLIDIFSGPRMPSTQPINFVTSRCPPMLLATGDADDEVDPANTSRMSKKLQADGDEVKSISYADLGHIGIALSLADGFRDRAPVLKDIVDFVRVHSITNK